MAFKVIVVNTSAVLKAMSSTVEPLVAVQDVAIWNMTVPRVSREKNINRASIAPVQSEARGRLNWAESASAKLRVPSWIFVPVRQLTVGAAEVGRFHALSAAVLLQIAELAYVFDGNVIPSVPDPLASTMLPFASAVFSFVWDKVPLDCATCPLLPLADVI